MLCINSVIECTIIRKIPSQIRLIQVFVKPTDVPIPQPMPLTMPLRVQNVEFTQAQGVQG